MKIIQILSLLLFCVFITPAVAQQGKELSIAGKVIDINNNTLPNVSIYIKDKPSSGLSTDNSGKF